MSRYLIDTPAKLQRVRVALDQANGFLDNNELPTNRMLTIVHPDGSRQPIPSGLFYASYGVAPTTTVGPPVIGDDGSAALELPEHPTVDPHLGRTIRGTAIARARDLVPESGLPGRVRAELDRRRSQDALERALGLR